MTQPTGEYTRTPELTPVGTRLAGIALLLAAAVVPVPAWLFAVSVVSLIGLCIAVSAWAALALVAFLALGRTSDAKRLALLVCGCAAGWSLLLSIAFWFMIRGEFHGEDVMAISGGKILPSDVMVIYGVAAAATGAIYGFLCFLRYRDLPRTFTRAMRMAAYATLPGVVLCLLVFGLAAPDRYELMVVVAPFVLALLVTAVARTLPATATTPAGRS